MPSLENWDGTCIYMYMHNYVNMLEIYALYIYTYIYTHDNSFWNSYCARTCTCVLCTCISMYVHVKTSGKSKQDTRQCMSQAVYTHIHVCTVPVRRNVHFVYNTFCVGHAFA